MKKRKQRGLKDWEKIREGVWRRKNSSYKDLGRKMPSEVEISKNPNVLKKYELTIWTNLHSIKESKAFKTKSQTLKFAKAYMRKH